MADSNGFSGSTGTDGAIFDADGIPGIAGASDDPIVVAIDGPAGSGKSSVARLAAEQLGFRQLDTGAWYRVITWLGLHWGDLEGASAESQAQTPEKIPNKSQLQPQSAINRQDPAQLALLLQQFDRVITDCFESDRIIAAGSDITDAIRKPEISSQVKHFSSIPQLRDHLNRTFRQLVAASQLPGFVVEGRDITTVTFPSAQIRIILTASPEVRARRRALQLGLSEDIESTIAAIEKRDQADLQVVDFMNPAPGVQLIDTSEITLDEAVKQVVKLVESVS